MKILHLSELLNTKIENIRYQYTPRNEYDCQQFFSYIKLSSGVIIDIPVFYDEEFLELTEENISFFKNEYDKGTEYDDSAKSIFVGQTITDLHFVYIDGENHGDHRAYIELSNGYYLTENNFGPIGVTDVSLVALNQNEFKQNIESPGIEIKSYLNLGKNVC